MLLIHSTRRSLLGDRAFPVAAAQAWNSAVVYQTCIIDLHFLPTT